MAGIMSDHTEAATITPAANPRSAFCTREETLSRVRKTNAEPITVPAKGMRSIGRISITYSCNEGGRARIVLAAPFVIGIICIIRADFRRTKL